MTVALLHVVKTAGSSLWAWIEKNADEVKRPEAWMFASVNGHDYVQSHNLKWVPDDGINYGIVLRDPADWYVSVYHHDAARREHHKFIVQDFERWYEEGGVNTVIPQDGNRNRMMYYCGRFCGSLDRLEEMVRSCWFVSTAEHINEDHKQIADAFGIEPGLGRERGVGSPVHRLDNFPITRRFELTDEWRERIWEENPGDVALYQLALEVRNGKS
jgi:hypothetical protein